MNEINRWTFSEDETEYKCKLLLVVKEMDDWIMYQVIKFTDNEKPVLEQNKIPIPSTMRIVKRDEFNILKVMESIISGKCDLIKDMNNEKTNID